MSETCRCCGDSLHRVSTQGGTYIDPGHEADCLASKLSYTEQQLNSLQDYHYDRTKERDKLLIRLGSFTRELTSIHACYSRTDDSSAYMNLDDCCVEIENLLKDYATAVEGRGQNLSEIGADLLRDQADYLSQQLHEVTAVERRGKTTHCYTHGDTPCSCPEVTASEEQCQHMWLNDDGSTAVQEKCGHCGETRPLNYGSVTASDSL